MKKCRNFLSTLIKLTSNGKQSSETTANVKELIKKLLVDLPSHQSAFLSSIMYVAFSFRVLVFCIYGFSSVFIPRQEAKIEPEDFTSRLYQELSSSPQPYLVPFLKVRSVTH